MKELKASLETIQRTASEMIEELNKRLWHKAQEFYVGFDAETKHNSEVKNKKSVIEREVR
jgi:nucleoside-specific outer membrane channel protein Tsx